MVVVQKKIFGGSIIFSKFFPKDKKFWSIIENIVFLILFTNLTRKVLKPKTENNTAAKKENHNSTNNQAVESFNNDESSITASTTIDEFAKILKSIKLKPPNTKLKHNQRKRQRPIESLIPKQIKNNDQLEFKLQLKKNKLIKKVQKDKLIKNTKDSLFLKNTVKDLFKKNNE